MSKRQYKQDIRGWLGTKDTGNECFPKAKQNQKVKEEMSNIQNIQDIREWFRTINTATKCLTQPK